MSFLGLYRDPIIAANTAGSDWHIADLMTGERPVSLYLVVPPSDISRTRPLVRLILNQIARRLTETLPESRGAPRPRLLLMLDEFPALGRLDFFETSLAFMAGYGVRAFLVAQSLHQIDRAYGANHAILDNCHVRVAFAPNDERTARRLSDALGTTTELRHHKNLSGKRFSLFLPHMALAEQETSRPLLTTGEVLQLPPDDALVLVSGMPPIRARKLRYYTDRNFLARLLPAPPLGQLRSAAAPASRTDDWSWQTRATHAKLERAWSDLISTSTGRTPEQAPALDIAHDAAAEPQRHDLPGDTQADPGAEPDAQPAPEDDDLAPLLERPR
jgi:type IV secretion system protein VirD4